MKKKEPVSTIMTRHIHAVQIKDTLLAAMELVRKHNISHVPVLKGKQLVGIISKNDLHRLSFSDIMPGEEDTDEAVFDMLTISQVMSHKPELSNPVIPFITWLKFFLRKNYMLCLWFPMRTSLLW